MSKVPDDVVEREWRDLLEKDDRTSPPEYPEMALITLDELRAALEVAVAWERAEQEAKQWEARVESAWKMLDAHGAENIDNFFNLREALRVAREAINRATIGGNHLALIIGIDHPLYIATHEEALRHYGAGDKYEVWCCWKVLMEIGPVLSRIDELTGGEGE